MSDKHKRSKSDDDLKKFAKELWAGKIFTSNHIHNQSDVVNVFMPLGLMDTSSLDFNDIGIIYEYLDKAGPMATNGCPMFMSMNIMNIADTGFMHIEYKKIIELMGDPV